MLPVGNPRTENIDLEMNPFAAAFAGYKPQWSEKFKSRFTLEFRQALLWVLQRKIWPNQTPHNFIEFTYDSKHYFKSLEELCTREVKNPHYLLKPRLRTYFRGKVFQNEAAQTTFSKRRLHGNG